MKATPAMVRAFLEVCGRHFPYSGSDPAIEGGLNAALAAAKAEPAEPQPVAAVEAPTDEDFWNWWRATNKDVHTGDILKNDIVFYGRAVARAVLALATNERQVVATMADKEASNGL